MSPEPPANFNIERDIPYRQPQSRRSIDLKEAPAT